MTLQEARLAIIGLGYVGLPLAVEFGKKNKVLGFDINKARIKELESGTDNTLETSAEELKEAIHLSFTTDIDKLKDCNVFIITVTTPIEKNKTLI